MDALDYFIIWTFYIVVAVAGGLVIHKLFGKKIEKLLGMEEERD